MGMLATKVGYEKGEDWLDLRAYVKPEDMEEFVQKRCRLGVDYGQWFGKGYEGFIRLNLATDPARAAQNIAAVSV